MASSPLLLNPRHVTTFCMTNPPSPFTGWSEPFAAIRHRGTTGTRKNVGATAMSKTALIDALKSFDVDRVRTILEATPGLKDLRLDKGFNLLQICCARATVGDTSAAARQLRLAQWLVSQGFDPRVIHTTAAGEDGEEDPAELSLVWFA